MSHTPFECDDIDDLLDAATRFSFGDFHAELLIDTDNRDYGWIVTKNGKWEQKERMTREQAIDEAKRRNENK